MTRAYRYQFREGVEFGRDAFGVRRLVAEVLA